MQVSLEQFCWVLIIGDFILGLIWYGNLFGKIKLNGKFLGVIEYLIIVFFGLTTLTLGGMFEAILPFVILAAGIAMNLLILEFIVWVLRKRDARAVKNKNR